MHRKAEKRVLFSSWMKLAQVGSRGPQPPKPTLACGTALTAVFERQQPFRLTSSITIGSGLLPCAKGLKPALS